MEISLSIPPVTDDWPTLLAHLRDAEKVGVQQVWTGENWSHDCASRIGYIAAHTTTMKLGTIMQAVARTPAMTAMTASSLAAIAPGRFMLGLAASGPQVVEGLHGVPFQPAIQRIRETIEIVRAFACGQRLEFHGRVFDLPRPGGEGKALKTTGAPREFPIYVASLSPKSLRMTGEIADGWLGSSFVPEHADALLRELRAGAGSAGRSLGDLTLRVPAGVLAFTGDVERLLPGLKQAMAFPVTMNGSPRKNFYREAYERSGYTGVMDRVKELWFAGKREEAAASIPDELVLQTNLVGTRAMIRARLEAYRRAGAGVLRVDPAGSEAEKIEALGTLVEMAAAL